MKVPEIPAIAIDFDGVIHDAEHPRYGKRMGPPMPGALGAMKALYARGFRIIIHTTKAKTANGSMAVEQWLQYYEIEYHEVTAIKPEAVIYIDNKGYHHTSWTDTLKMLEQTLLDGEELVPQTPGQVVDEVFKLSGPEIKYTIEPAVKPNTSRAPENSQGWKDGNIIETFKNDLFEDEEDE